MTTPALGPAGHHGRPDATEKVGRLFRILTVIYARTPGRPLGRDALAEVCECSVRTISRDVDLLRAFGAPIAYDPTHQTYALTDTDWTYPIAPLTVEDALAFALARSLLSRPGVPYQDAILRALDKATTALPPELKALLAQAAQVLRPDAGDRDYSRAPIPELVAAAGQYQTVEIEYRSRSRGGEVAWRRVDPYMVQAREGQYWELHGWCHRNARIRTFALDQVRDMRLPGETFTVREGDWGAFSSATGIIGGLRGGPPAAVDVLFAPEVAPYALDRRWPDGLTLTRQPDGTARLTGTAQGVAGLVPELLRWRRHARVLGGPELCHAITDEAHALAALYPPLL